jgi:two-component system, sensor histidine kinase and response regulator
LIKNAIEAAPQQGFIRIESGEDESDPFQIINSGTVPPELREGFFEKFATAGKSGGSGLGTYSAKLMIEVQGGSIALDISEPDITCVQIWLPWYAAERIGCD